MTNTKLPFTQFSKLKQLLDTVAKDSLGIARVDMPQIKVDSLDSLKQWLNANSVSYIEKEIPAKQLKASQHEFDIEKVKTLLNKPCDGFLLASHDGYIIDGHHRWLCAVFKDYIVNVIEIQKDAIDLIPFLHSSDLSFTKALTESVVSDVYYHGTNQHIEKFEQKFARANNDLWGGGIAYFTSSDIVAQKYAVFAAKKHGGQANIVQVSINTHGFFDINSEYDSKEIKRLLKIGKIDDTESFLRASGMLPYGTNKYKLLTDLEQNHVHMSGLSLLNGLSMNIHTAKGRDILKKAGYKGLIAQVIPQSVHTAIHHTVVLPYDQSVIKIVKQTV